MKNPPLYMEYRSHRGPVEVRKVIPLRMEYRTSVHHSDRPRWLMVSFCLDRQAERGFAVEDIVRFIPDEEVS